MELDFDKYIKPYEKVNYIYSKNIGYIVWRTGTGENIELLHIKTFEKRKGHGRSLVKQMLEKINKDKSFPYYSIFGFTRNDNEEAHAFYAAIGFNIVDVSGVYKDGNCKLFWQSFEKLLENNI